jgi:hypothetical protein
VLLARFAFQACLIDRSSISPFRINDLRGGANHEIADCDKSSNVPRSLTVVSSIDGPPTVHHRKSRLGHALDASLAGSNIDVPTCNS